MSISLTVRNTGAPYADRKQKFYSTNKVVCPAIVNAKCDKNAMSWEGTADNAGLIRIPRDYIQQSNEVDVYRPDLDPPRGGWEPIAHFDNDGNTESTDHVIAEIINLSK